ncbi:F420-dependent oxidoreductase-like protein [Kineosphaera limosa]|uniref:Putative F420-dependent oxidoreductase n=1 Tax=Kineosphaera limosa NBRC 100340 TaxID=1184609 RepID=K6WK32_9MICO|nr:LLM class F420-dependent oxidoreductase [Kineosphaera limosa]NYE02301.1 F420-dependent oxidoreductase-like protein [Kineosphaera limosa]GAB94156.1 putative F420-dependent oxidoreductase [Kineosphaera limosa NBRC 100340]
MKLGLSLGYWGARPPQGVDELVTAAADMGYESIWTSEAYGSDALTPLTWQGARNPGLRLGTAVLQMSARTPTATAMAALTLDHLTGGKFALGIGASGPQVVEGWYGQPYPRPLARTREYVAILRQALARADVEFDGEHYQVPLQGGAGLGKPLHATIRPLRTDLPILLAAEGPKNVALAAEIADGWIPLFYAPDDDATYRARLAEGFARRAADDARRVEDFEVACPVQVVLDDDVEAAADTLRPMIALYVGGMGAKGANFHNEAIARLGFEAECAAIQEAYLAGRRQEAIAAVPTKMVDKIALVGPKARIAERFAQWESSLVTTLLVAGAPKALQALAQVA